MNYRCFFGAVLLALAPLWGYAGNNFYQQLAQSAAQLTRQTVIYDPAYYKIAYPGGDVPADRGVCTDVIIRAYRGMGIDLQKEVHEDMKKNFPLYPKHWGLKTTDRNIDHRRVPNLMVFFTRHGKALEISDNPADYRPGDMVVWDLGAGVLHIGMVTAQKSTNGTRPMIVHNIGAGQVQEDILFNFKIIGHYRYQKNQR